MEIRRCTIAELASAPNLAECLAEYARESGLPEIGPASAQVETYFQLESAGVLHPIGAFDGDRLLGMVLQIITVLPHYGVPVVTAESFFVPRAERKQGIGLRLLAGAEALGRELRARAQLLSAPVGGALAQVLPRRGYRQSNAIFVKALA